MDLIVNLTIPRDDHMILEPKRGFEVKLFFLVLVPVIGDDTSQGLPPLIKGLISFPGYGGPPFLIPHCSHVTVPRSNPFQLGQRGAIINSIGAKRVMISPQPFYARKGRWHTRKWSCVCVALLLGNGMVCRPSHSVLDSNAFHMIPALVVKDCSSDSRRLEPVR